VAYTVRFKPSAGKFFAKLPRDLQERIRDRIDALGTNPRPPGVKKLEGEENVWRIRVGDFRILYEVNDKDRLVSVDRIGHRGDVYK